MAQIFDPSNLMSLVNQSGAPPLTLYDMLGGEATLSAVIDGVYQRMFQDPALAFFVRGHDIEEAKDFQLEFFGMILVHGLPPDTENMVDALKDKLSRLFVLGLNEQHFDVITGYVVLTLQSFNVNRLTVIEVVRTFRPLRQIFEEGAAEARNRHVGARRSLTL